MNPVVGHMHCPICSAVKRNTMATVHREKRGKRAYYLRCPQCGTIQPRMAAGQDAMRYLMKPVEDSSGADPAHGTSSDKPKPEQKPVEAKKKGGFSRVIRSLLEED